MVDLNNMSDKDLDDICLVIRKIFRMCMLVMTEKVITNNQIRIVQYKIKKRINSEAFYLADKYGKAALKLEKIGKRMFRIIAQEIYCALEPMEFSFDFCEINEDIVDFEANLKNDFMPFTSTNKDELQVHKLNDSFALLPEQQRLAFLMFYILKMSLSEIAELFNVKEAKAKSIVANARKKLNTSIPFFRKVILDEIKARK